LETDFATKSVSTPSQEPEMPRVSNRSTAIKARRDKGSSSFYRVRNWAAYDQALKQRGSVTLWFSPEAVPAWGDQGPAQRGAQFVYSDTAIETALTLRLIYDLALRQTEGFVESVLALMGLDRSAPDHSTLSRRQRGLSIQCPTRVTNEPIHVVVDSTGLKVYGEGEWKVRQHGWSVHRTWRKLHVGVNEATGEIVAETLTENSVDDASQVAPLLAQIDDEVEMLSGDGGYDKNKVFKALADPPQEAPIQALIALRKDAKIQQHGNRNAPPLARDEILRAIREKGRKGWKQQSGYHRRSLAETQMFRYKQIIGDKLRARGWANQQVESRLACAILNRMTHLGRPDSDKVEKGN
jgi:IS5 family transposase